MYVKNPTELARPVGFHFELVAPYGRGGMLNSHHTCTHEQYVMVTRFYWIILRKEVIQPQVPLRLPCYDLVPIRKSGVDA